MRGSHRSSHVHQGNSPDFCCALIWIFPAHFCTNPSHCLLCIPLHSCSQYLPFLSQMPFSYRCIIATSRWNCRWCSTWFPFPFPSHFTNDQRGQIPAKGGYQAPFRPGTSGSDWEVPETLEATQPWPIFGRWTVWCEYLFGPTNLMKSQVLLNFNFKIVMNYFSICLSVWQLLKMTSEWLNRGKYSGTCPKWSIDIHTEITWNYRHKIKDSLPPNKPT